MKEDKQEILTAICEALRKTSAAGYPGHNPLAEIRYIQKSNGDEVARPVFEDGAGLNGYYDVNITGDSGIGMWFDLTSQFIRKVW